ncbi:hypothetical protein N0V86_007248 [Didymella sp. IMI 355093]|nr:hypothetical protein N0V86_007248 [Didymella sp. IMI 355093]
MATLIFHNSPDARSDARHDAAKIAHIKSKLCGATFSLNDKSEWRIGRALSATAYQQDDPPLEARQVFGCICIRDPGEQYTTVKVAVVKVKYQIQGTEESIEELKDLVSEYEEITPMSKQNVEANLRYAKQKLNTATHPVHNPNSATSNEIQALKRFRDSDCPHTPHLIVAETQRLVPELDQLSIPEGFLTWTIMTHLPGVRLISTEFWEKPEWQREQIRQAFKIALM